MQDEILLQLSLGVQECETCGSTLEEASLAFEGGEFIYSRSTGCQSDGAYITSDPIDMATFIEGDMAYYKSLNPDCIPALQKTVHDLIHWPNNA